MDAADADDPGVSVLTPEPKVVQPEIGDELGLALTVFQYSPLSRRSCNDKRTITAIWRDEQFQYSPLSRRSCNVAHRCVCLGPAYVSVLTPEPKVVQLQTQPAPSTYYERFSTHP